MNKNIIPLIAAVLLVMVACKKKPYKYQFIEPAQTEHIEGSELSKLTLTPEAVVRTDIKTAIVKANPEPSETSPLILPYASIIYDTHGKTWVYTNPEQYVYIREEVKIDRIQGNTVYITEGPMIGTTIVVTGSAELLGTEFHVGH